MYCQFCGGEIDDNSKFCSNCGKKLNEEENTAVEKTKDFSEEIKSKVNSGMSKVKELKEKYYSEPKYIEGGNVENFIGKGVSVNYIHGIESIGGKVNFDEIGLKFEPNQANTPTEKLEINYSEISEVVGRNILGVVPNGISIFTRNHDEQKFVASTNRNELILFLQSKIKK